MTRREVAFLAIGLDFSALVSSFLVAYEYARHVTDWHSFSEMFDVLGMNPYAFLLPAAVLLTGLALLATKKKSTTPV